MKKSTDNENAGETGVASSDMFGDECSEIVIKLQMVAYKEDKEAFDQVDGRTADFIVCDWNPSFNHHWIFDRIMASGREFFSFFVTLGDS